MTVWRRLCCGLAAALALAAAYVLFALPWDYCMDGRGYGIPFAWWHPGHGEEWAWPLQPEAKFSPVIDAGNLLASLLLWAGLVLLLQSALRGRWPLRALAAVHPATVTRDTKCTAGPDDAAT